MSRKAQRSELKMDTKDMQKTGEEIVKRGRGRPKGTGGNERPEQQVQTLPGDNTKYTANALEIFRLPKIDMSDEAQVAQRCDEYFAICAKNDMKPSIEGLALALGIDRSNLFRYRTGQTGKNEEVRNTLKKAADFINLLMADYMQNGKINPVSGIFLMKNNFQGYADKQEFVITPQSPLGEGSDAKQLEDRYKDTVVIDQ